MFGCSETVPHAHQYVNDNGELKWFASEASFIDGYEWSPITKPINIMNLGECDEIKESHANLYLSKTNNLLLPIYSDKEVIDDEFYRTQYVSFLSEDKCELLRKLGLFRVVDNLFILDNYKLRNFEQGVLTTFISLETQNVEKNEVIFRHNFSEYKSGEKYPTDYIYNLLYPGVVIFTDEQSKKCKEDNLYISIPIVKNYQKSLVRPPFINE